MKGEASDITCVLAKLTEINDKPLNSWHLEWLLRYFTDSKIIEIDNNFVYTVLIFGKYRKIKISIKVKRNEQWGVRQLYTRILIELMMWSLPTVHHQFYLFYVHILKNFIATKAIVGHRPYFLIKLYYLRISFIKSYC